MKQHRDTALELKTRGNEAFRAARTEDSLGIYRDAIAQFPFALPPAAESATDARAVKRPGAVALADELAVLYANCAACLLQMVCLTATDSINHFKIIN